MARRAVLRVEFAASAIAAILLLAPCPAGAAEPSPRADPRQYTHPHQLIDVGGGRKMNLFCLGRGAPTIVFDADAGSPGWDWLLVQPAVAKRNRACVYDRAGLGFSEPSGRKGTSADAVGDLHALLAAASLLPPFVLVGQGYGGMNAQLYAYTYPAEVTGLVLVDAPHEDEVARIDLLTNGQFSQAIAAVNIGFLKDCTAAAESAGAANRKAFARCVESQFQDRRAYGPVLSMTMRRSVGAARHWRANFAEESNLPTSADQLRAARKSFGTVPLAYLTRGISPYLTPGRPQSATNQAIETEVAAMHDEIARLSTQGSNRVVPGAGHNIHLDKPQAVIDAIDMVLSEQ